MLPFVGSFPAWVTLTIAGLAMGMMIFIMASGLTLVFGLMDVLNFGHGAFVSVGAYAATLVLLPLRGLDRAPIRCALNLAAVALAIVVAMVATGLVGLVFERLLVRPVYGQHLRQILVTMGGAIVTEQLLGVIWGPEQIPLPLPETLRGAIVLGDVAIEKYRLLAVVVGLAVFAAMFLVLNRTRIGLLIRAGVENRAMVEALGYRIRRALRRRVRRRLRARRARRRAVGAVPRDAHRLDGRRDRGDGVHRHHHRRAGLGRRLLHRRAPHRAGGQLRRVPRAEGGARLQHPADGGDPALAPAGLYAGGRR